MQYAARREKARAHSVQLKHQYSQFFQNFSNPRRKKKTGDSPSGPQRKIPIFRVPPTNKKPWLQASESAWGKKPNGQKTLRRTRAPANSRPPSPDPFAKPVFPLPIALPINGQKPRFEKVVPLLRFVDENLQNASRPHAASDQWVPFCQHRHSPQPRELPGLCR